MLMNEAISWNSLISAFHHLRLPNKSLLLYQRMLAANVKETSRTFPSLLSASNNLCIAEQLHSRIFSLGFISNPFVSSALVSLYSKISRPHLAVELLNELPEITAAACNSILKAWTESPLEMMTFFSEMKVNGVSFTAVSFSYALQGCLRGRLLLEGKQVHCCSVKSGFLPSDIFVANGLVDFYSACEICGDATIAVEEIADGEIISWNSVVAVHSSVGLIAAAVGFLRRMMAAGMRPCVRTLVSLLNSCGRSRDLLVGRIVHCLAVKLGFDWSSFYVLSALIHAYGKCGDVDSFVYLWEEFSEDVNLECCNSMITSLVHSGLMDDAVKVFTEMGKKILKPDCVTMSVILRALSSSPICSLVSVLQIHCWVVKLGLAADVAVACSLISAYSRTGGSASGVIIDVPEPNLVCFTAAISAFGRIGEGREAIATMEEMIGRGILPDKVAFLSAMASCDHAGMVEEGRRMLWRMEDLGLELDRRHFCAMVSLLARAGMVVEAAEMASRSPPDEAAWSSVLRSSSEYGEVEVGRTAARKLLELRPWSPETRRQIAGFFAAVDDLEAFVEAKKTVRSSEMWKKMGISSVESQEKLS